MAKVKETVKPTNEVKQYKQYIQKLEDKTKELLKTITTQGEDIARLEKEKESKLDSVDMVPRSELVAEISRTKQAIFRAEQNERNFENEKKTRIKLEERFKNEKENKPIDSATTTHLEARIKELEAKLSRSNAGRKENKHKPEDILRLRSEGKTIRAICQECKMSTVTVVEILKGFKGE